MKKRNLAFVIIFSLISLGLYELYWLIQTRKEMVRSGAKIPTIWIVAIPLFLLVLSLASALILPSDNLRAIVSFVFVLIAFLGVIPLIIYWIYKYCKAVEFITEGKLGFGLNFGLWLAFNILGVFFIWPGIVQDHFNKIGNSAPSQGQTPISATSQVATPTVTNPSQSVQSVSQPDSTSDNNITPPSPS